MARTGNDLIINIIAQDRASDDLKKVNNSLEKNEQQSKKTNRSMKSLVSTYAKTAAIAGSVYLALRKVVSIGVDLLDAYSKQEKAEKQLQSALQATGQYTEDNFKRLKDMASQLQQVTTVGDETSLQYMQMALNMGASADEMDRVIQGAIGLSKSLGISMRRAIQGVTNGLNGTYTTLQRYVTALRTAEKESEKARIFQEKLNQAFVVARSELKTTEGLLKSNANLWGDIKEELGEVINIGIKPYLEDLKLTLTGMLDTLKEVKSESSDLKPVVDNLKAAWQSINVAWDNSIVKMLTLQPLLEQVLKLFKSKAVENQKNRMDELNVSLNDTALLAQNLGVITLKELNNMADRWKEYKNEVNNDVDSMISYYTQQISSLQGRIQQELVVVETDFPNIEVPFTPVLNIGKLEDAATYPQEVIKNAFQKSNEIALKYGRLTGFGYMEETAKGMEENQQRLINVGSLFSEVFANIFDPGKTAGETVKSLILGVLNALQAAAVASEAFSLAWSQIFVNPGAAIAALVAIQGAKAAVQSIEFAEGGAVTGPVNALIGEGGEPEFVLPYSKARKEFQEMGDKYIGNNNMQKQIIINYQAPLNLSSQKEIQKDVIEVANKGLEFAKEYEF